MIYLKEKLMIKKFIKSIREEKDGFRIDKPWRLEEKSLGVIIPILRKSQRQRSYITLAEAKKIKVEDTGQIDYVFVTSGEEKPILISRGEVFRGKTQERAAIHDHIVMPGKGLRVTVRCIHQSKGINQGTEMFYGGRTPYEVGFKTQHQTWCNVQSAYNSSFKVFSTRHSVADDMTEQNEPAVFGASVESPLQGADDLVGTLDSMSDAIKQAMKKIPFLKDQVGAAFLHENKMLGMDIYDLADSWDAVKKEVVEKEGASFIKKDDETQMFEFKPERGNALLKKCLSDEFEEKEIYNRDYRVVELRSPGLLGEVIEFEGKVIHLTLWKRK